MTRNVPDKERQKLSAEVSLLESLDVEQLRARWKILFETEAPPRFSRDLLMRAVAYRIQERVLGGLKPKSTAAALRNPLKTPRGPCTAIKVQLPAARPKHS
jgi:hypothetical protein